MTKPYKPKSNAGKIWGEVQGLLVALFVALLIRNFLYEPFKIPSSSMVPTLLVGDFLFVNKFAYGIKSPYTDDVLNQELPQRGDVLVFRKADSVRPSWCHATDVINTVFVGLNDLVGCSGTAYIKRVIALPGDKIAYQNKHIYINDNKVDYKLNDSFYYVGGRNHAHEATRGTEHLNGVVHDILIDDERMGQNVAPMIVPEGKIVMMGDNRDNSIDSRFWLYPEWGFIDQSQIVGRAEVIFWSWQNWIPRLERLFTNLRAEHEESKA